MFFGSSEGINQFTTTCFVLFHSFGQKNQCFVNRKRERAERKSEEMEKRIKKKKAEIDFILDPIVRNAIEMDCSFVKAIILSRTKKNNSTSTITEWDDELHKHRKRMQK